MSTFTTIMAQDNETREHYINRMQGIVENINHHGYIDEHDGKHKDSTEFYNFAGIAIKDSGEACMLFHAPYFSMNAMYEDEESVIHLGQRSNGGVFRGDVYKMENWEQYNDHQMFHNIVDVFLDNGTHLEIC